MTTFCWFPPDSPFAWCFFTLPTLMRSSSTDAFTGCSMDRLTMPSALV